MSKQLPEKLVIYNDRSSTQKYLRYGKNNFVEKRKCCEFQEDLFTKLQCLENDSYLFVCSRFFCRSLCYSGDVLETDNHSSWHHCRSNYHYHHDVGICVVKGSIQDERKARQAKFSETINQVQQSISASKLSCQSYYSNSIW